MSAATFPSTPALSRRVATVFRIEWKTWAARNSFSDFNRPNRFPIALDARDIRT